jgi:DNA-binding MarR family transcriptional regulator
MNYQDKSFQIHSLYNLSRYLFLKIESNYGSIVEQSGITLPQLRVLWIIKSFPGISLREIAQIGCWSPPTVTNILKKLFNKSLVYKEETTNKKQYRLNLTNKGEEYILINKQNKSSKLILLKLLNLLNEYELENILDFFKHIMIKLNSDIIFEYIVQLNSLSLKIDYKDFKSDEDKILKKLIYFYNMLRIFVLKIQNNHNILLKNLNLTYPQLRALWILEAFQGITSNQLSQLGFWSPSTANLIVKNLDLKGLVHKIKGEVKNDIHLYISTEGENLLLKDLQINQRKLDVYKIVETMSTEQLESLNTILYKMNNMVDNNMLDIYIKQTYKIREE